MTIFTWWMQIKLLHRKEKKTHEDIIGQISDMLHVHVIFGSWLLEINKGMRGCVWKRKRMINKDKWKTETWKNGNLYIFGHFWTPQEHSTQIKATVSMTKNMVSKELVLFFSAHNLALEAVRSSREKYKWL